MWKRLLNKRFRERKAKGTSQDAKPGPDIDEEKTIPIAILGAIVILAVLIVNLVLMPAPKAPFFSIYLLDSEKQTANFPTTVVLGENNTFVLWVGVENQNVTSIPFSVLVKFDDGISPTDPSPADPTESFEKSLSNKDIWEFPVTITIDQLGRHRIIFELQYFDKMENDFKYSGKYVSLSFEAI